MKHLFIPYELALKAKEAGFKEPCMAIYRTDFADRTQAFQFMGENMFTATRNSNPILAEQSFTAPLYQQIIDWFRDKHGLVISISPGYSAKWYNVSTYGITKNGKAISKQMEDIFFGGVMDMEAKTYYDALNKAIEQAFTLIKDK